MATKRKRATPAASAVSEDRLLQRASLLMANGRHTTLSLAKALRVSAATAFRLVQELRRRGVPVKSVRRAGRWCFVVNDEEAVARAWKDDPLVRGVGFIRGTRPRHGDVDDELYGQE